MSVTTESPSYAWIKEEGSTATHLRNARVMLRKSYPLTDIIEITGLIEEQLKDANLNGRKQKE